MICIRTVVLAVVLGLSGLFATGCVIDRGHHHHRDRDWDGGYYGHWDRDGGRGDYHRWDRD